MIGRKFNMTSFLILSLSFFLHGQEKLDLAKAIEVGLRNNFQIQIANTEIELARYRYKNTFKDRLPIIAINISQNNNVNKVNSPTSFVEGYYSDVGLSGLLDANWAIFDGFKNKANKHQLKSLENLSISNADLIIENAIHAIQLAYYGTVIKLESVKNIEEVLRLSAEKLTDAHSQFDLGKISEYEVLRFENAFLADSSQLVIAKNEYELSLQKLNLAIGNKNLIEYELVEPIRYLEQSFSCKKLLPRLIHENKKIRNQMTNIALKRSGILAQKANWYPTLTVNGGINKRWNSIKFDDIPKAKGEDLNFFLNFTLTYNLFDGGITARGIEESKIQTTIEEFKLEEMNRTLKSELCQYIFQYNSQLEIVKINEKLIKNLQRNLEMLDDQIRSGFASALEYRIVQIEYLNAQKNRLESINLLKSTEVMIAKLTGGLGN